MPPSVNCKSGFVVVLGMSSAGKSTLINAIVGEKIAIVSSKCQSTRVPMRGIYTDSDSQIVFVDTPGFFKPNDKLEEYMLNSMINSIYSADVILFLNDIAFSPESLPKEFKEMVLKAKQPKILAISKIDRVKNFKIAENIELLNFSTYFDQTVLISAVNRMNVDKLIGTVKNYLTEGPMLYPEDEITDVSSKFIVTEIVRESICGIVHDEIPYSIAVYCDELTQRENKKYFIACTIFVERDSQKGIIIGKNGTTIKKIGTRSREIIEKVLGISSFLELNVKVAEKWRKDDRYLNMLGYFARRDKK